MATTTNFGWETPDDTDLVKDGAAAMRTLGNSIDTSMADLKGGTTGQVLSKASNTDMDFIWVAQDDSNAIQNAIVDAKGDLISATAADTPARLAVGTNGQVLTVDSTTATGLKWASPASTGALTYVGGASFTGSSSQSLNNVFSSTYLNYLILLNVDKSTTGTLKFRLRSGGSDNTTSNYYSTTTFLDYNSTASGTSKFAAAQEWNTPDIISVYFPLTILSPQASTETYLTVPNFSFKYSPGQYTGTMSAFFNATTSFDGITIYPTSGTMTGSVRVYGIANS